MRRMLLSTALVVFAWFSFNPTPGLAGNGPRYLVLAPSYKGHATAMPAQTYAYGWFGAMPSSESFYHRYYNNTTRAVFFSRGY